MPELKPNTQATADAAAAAEAAAALEATRVAEAAAASASAIDGAAVQKTEAELQAERAAASAKEEADRAAADAAVAEDAKKTGGLNKRFSELTSAAKEARKQAAESDKRLKIALDAVEKLTGKPAAVIETAVVEDQEPTPPAFEAPEQYQREMAKYTADLVAYTTKRAIKAQQVEDQKARIQSDNRAATARVQTEFSARVNAFKAETPDYDEVAGNPDVSITPAMASTIALLPQGPKVAYFLGSNPLEADRISALPVLLQLAELGVLQARLAAAPVVRKTNAPAPIRPLAGGGTPSDTSLADKPMEEYAAARQAQLRGGKSGGVTH